MAGDLKRRFLLLCMRYPTSAGQSYLTTELAEALIAAGHAVEVLLLDWHGEAHDRPRVETLADGIRIVRCAAPEIRWLGDIVRRASKFLLSGWAVARAARHLALASCDVAIAWMPAIAFAPLIGRLRAAGVADRLLIIWDFFPDHHREIGRIPSGLPFRLARIWEQRLLKSFTAIICTLPGNAAYLRANYALSSDQRLLVTPIWADASLVPGSDRASIRAEYGLPLDAPIAVFGGQLVEGRGFDQMLEAAAIGQAAGSPLVYLFVGDGRLVDEIRTQAGRRPNVRHLASLSREAYLGLLGACDCGLVATVPGVRSFSIPSKTIDYLRAGLPIVAAVEPGSDFADLVERHGIGAIVPFEEAAAFHRAAERLATDPALRKRARRAAQHCLETVFDIRHAVATLETALSP